MSDEKHRQKRWKREHGRRTAGADTETLRRNRRQILARAQAAEGTPFKKLPGNPDNQKIVGTCEDGTPIPAGAVEMVYNDALMIDAAYGAGHYERVAGTRERQVLTLARQLYAAGATGS